MSMKALRKALKSKIVDEFESGTVIRWTASQRYTYAALKVDNGMWYTTATNFNSFVDQVVNFDTLVEILARAEVSEIQVSDNWLSLNG